MKPKLTVDTAKFNALVRDLARNTGRSVPQIVDGETAAILSRALTLTKSAKVAKLREGAADFEWMTLPGKRRVKRTWRLPAKDWQLVQARQREKLAKFLGARGLSKKQFLVIASQLGIKLAGVPTYVARAVSMSKEYRNKINSTTGRNKTPLTYTVGFVLKYPLAFFREVGMASALNSAVRGRVAFFKRNLKEGVFKDQASIAAKYGAVVTRIP